MAGVLEFTIGLQVNEFLHNVGMSTEKLLSLEAIGEGLHRVFERVSAAIEQGTALEHLSRRSGETAGNLYKLQQGLEAAGVSAGELPTMLFMMQKALGGVSEMGESTADVFHKLGLNIADLKRQGPAEAFSAIMGRMGGLTQDSAAKASSMIFGRMGAGSAVQVSRSPEEFREAVAASARQADIFERMAGSAGRFHASMLGVKREVGGLFAGLAEGVLPALNSLGEKLGSINLTKFGLRIGDEITAAFEAVRLEKFGEYFKLTLQSATFDVANFFGRMLQDALGNKQGGGSFGSRLGHGLAGAAALLGAAPFELGSQMAGGAGGNPLAELAFSQLSKSFGWVANAANLGADVGGALQGGAMGAGANPFSAQLEQLRANLLASARGRGGAGGGAAGAGVDINFGGGLTHRTEGNVFEKMGFVMGGAGGPAHDTARNTARTADLLTDIRAALVRDPQALVKGDVHSPM